MKLNITIPRLMKEQGITLSKLAVLSETPKTSLHSMIGGKGQKAVNLNHLRKIAQVLNVSIHYLAFDEPDPNEQPSQEILKRLFEGDIRVTIDRIERKK